MEGSRPVITSIMEPGLRRVEFMSCIVLAEDDRAAAALICRYVEALAGGHCLTVFSQASQALAYAGNNHVDLFILDIQLLDYRGTELAKQLRSMPDYRFTPILFTTELAGEELASYREIKCYDFLVKPFTEAEFRAAFHGALEMGGRLQRTASTLRIEQKQFVFEYDIRNILYIESFGKRIVIHTMTDSGSRVSDNISGYSLVKLLELSGGDRLIQCHKSYLVNQERICRVDKGNRQLYLRGCEEPVPVGEKYQRELWGRGAL